MCDLVCPVSLGGDFVRTCNTLQKRFLEYETDEQYVYESIVDSSPEIPFEVIGIGSTRVACRYTGETPTDTSYVVKLSYGCIDEFDKDVTYEGEFQSQMEPKFIREMYRKGDMLTCSMLAPIYVPTGVVQVRPEYSWVMMKEYPLMDELYPDVSMYHLDNCLFDVVEQYQLDMGARNVGFDFSWSDEYSVDNLPDPSNTHAFCRSAFFVDYGLFEEYKI